MKPRVAIIDCNRNGVASIRSIGRAGAEIIAVDHLKRRSGRYSKYAHWKHIICKPNEDEQRFIDDLMSIGQRYQQGNQKVYLLPVNDEYVRTLAAHWNTLQAHFIALFETDSKQLDHITNKVNFSAHCGSIGIPQPAKYSPKDILEDRASYPIIFKPDERRSLENISIKIFKVKLCRNKQEATEFLNYLDEMGIEVIIQQFIPGGDDELYTGGVVAWNGKLLGCFTGKKVRQFPPMAGQASLAVALESDKLVAYSERIVKSLGFTGIAQIEFKHHNGELYVIEMNPRSWSWHSLAQAAGVDLPKILLEAAQGVVPNQVLRNQRNGIYWHYFIEDLIYNVILNRNISLGALIRSARTAASHGFYDPKDLGPWLNHVLVEYPIRIAQLVLRGK